MKVAQLCVLAMLLTSCTVTFFSEPVTISTKPSPAAHHPSGTFVSERVCTRFTLVFLQVGYGGTARAYQRALAKAPGADTLVDWNLKHDMLMIVPPYLYYQDCVTVEGTAVKTADVLPFRAR